MSEFRDSFPRDLDALRAAYLESLVLRNLSPLSIRQVDLDLRVFLGWGEGQGVREPGQVDRDGFERYKHWLSVGYRTRKNRPLEQNTVVERLNVVKAWFAWMRKKGAIVFDPIAEVRVPKTQRRLPKGVLRPDEVRKVMEQPDLATALGYRDRTMMEVLYATGVRARELVGLRLPDVDLRKKVVRVRNGKGGKDRFAPLSTPCCRFLERYMSEVRPELAQGLRPAGNNWLKKQGTGQDFLFLSLYGGPFSPTWLSELMKGCFLKAGVTRAMSPVHGWRHSVATHLIADGMDVRYVQVMLGHDSINSTQIYTHVERETLQRMLKDFHPSAKRGGDVIPFRDDEPKEAHAAAA